MGLLTPSTTTSSTLSPSPGPYTTPLDYAQSMFPQVGATSPCSLASESQHVAPSSEPVYQPLELQDDDLPIGMLASNLANPMLGASPLSSPGMAQPASGGGGGGVTGKRGIDLIDDFMESIKKQRMEPNYNLAMMTLLNEMAPMISGLNELPQTIKTEHDQMLLEQFCLSLTDSIDQEPSQEVNQYVNLDMCSDEQLQSRQMPAAAMPSVESAFKVDQATMEQLSLPSAGAAALYPSPIIPMHNQSNDPALASAYRTPSNENYVPEWSTPACPPGQALFPDLGRSQARSQSPAGTYGSMLASTPPQHNPPVYSLPTSATAGAPPHAHSRAAPPADNRAGTSISREQRVEPNVRTVPVIMPGHAIKTQATPGMARMPLYPQPAIAGYRPMEVQRHAMMPQREVMYSKPEAEPFHVRMNYIDEGGFVDVDVDRIADQLGGLSVSDSGPQVYRAPDTRASVRKTAVDYKTRQEHKALIEALLERLLDAHGRSGTSQEVS
ncbi:hypothetical protein SYNPS1DRAFT_24343 [Syncephalis pseudoplumigaleata]|uniref:Uncharacterized protein n=1 Tax=Syncephalis pseudoplumigaleata TaxID=1712513 RepID=A0A4P9YUY7_9FUNG|nr:hypothetical protein SYNPS1DRAFT_24343 [Syncephalis pseudoplumigaleata]|eukprot:RKP23588.1 hypothetical protein SYNPS1DRAFT_24343 [Syncephalis pseudoplumigaleata]